MSQSYQECCLVAYRKPISIDSLVKYYTTYRGQAQLFNACGVHIYDSRWQESRVIG
jgi:hypothetical protein